MIAIRPRTLGLIAASAILVAACGGTSSGGSAAGTSEASPAAGGNPPASPGEKLTATIVTPMGDIVIALKPDTAPIATANFVKLAESSYYDGVAFHRLVPGFVIQAGDAQFGKADAFDPERVGTGGPGYTIKDEPVVGEEAGGLLHPRGLAQQPRVEQPAGDGGGGGDFDAGQEDAVVAGAGASGEVAVEGADGGDAGGGG